MPSRSKSEPRRVAMPIRAAGAWLSLGLAGLIGPAGAGAHVGVGVLEQPASSAGREPTAGIELADALSDAFAHASEVIGPSVVNIVTYRTGGGGRAGGMQGLDPEQFRGTPFWEFFGDSLREQLEEQMEQRRNTPRDNDRRGDGIRDNDAPRVPAGQGSGVIVSEDGIILTNNHVIEGGDSFEVRLADDSVYEATLVGTDPQTDVAVLRIEGDGFTAASFADSDRVRVGQWVVAAGSPFGLRSSITAGVVSATGRTSVGIVGPGGYEDFIQTDAAINPGNSGGPLVNLRGEIVGINTAIASQSGGFMGVGFAIPANLARSIMDDLIDDGAVSRGYLGVTLQIFDAATMSESFDYEGRGVLVTEVMDRSPADRAGLEVGDIITAINGREVWNINQVRLYVASQQPGEEIGIDYIRGGRERDLDVTLGELAATVASLPARPEPEPESPVSGVIADMGLEVAPLTEQARQALGVREENGLVVTEVQRNSAAGRAGLQVNDVILRVDRHEIADADDLERAIEDADLRIGARVIIRRNEARRFVILRDE